jgi:hypothetical protein
LHHEEHEGHEEEGEEKRRNENRENEYGISRFNILLDLIFTFFLPLRALRVLRGAFEGR